MILFHRASASTIFRTSRFWNTARAREKSFASIRRKRRLKLSTAPSVFRKSTSRTLQTMKRFVRPTATAQRRQERRTAPLQARRRPRQCRPRRHPTRRRHRQRSPRAARAAIPRNRLWFKIFFHDGDKTHQGLCYGRARIPRQGCRWIFFRPCPRAFPAPGELWPRLREQGAASPSSSGLPRYCG